MGGTLPGIDDCGVRINDDGVFFCVWAPNAEAVAITGDFADWRDDGLAMAKGKDGCWFIDVPAGRVGQEYKYLITYQGKVLQRNDPRALQLTDSGDSSLIVDPAFEWHDQDFTLAPREQLIIYELHIGTFARHDPAMAGTFDDAATKLDYLKALGINAIEIMPCNDVWMDRWWGYTPDNIYAIETSYGGRLAFQKFVQAAHDHGIGVILDVVYNHLNKDPGLDLWQFDGWSETPETGGLYFYNDHRAHTPWGETRPDFSRPEVRRYITDNVRMWIRDCHVDGLRIDSVLEIRNTEGNNNDPAHDLGEGWQLLQEINRIAHDAKPDVLTIAEDLQGNEWITKASGDGGAGFEAQWDPALGGVLREQLDQLADESRNLGNIRFGLEHTMNGDAFKRVIFTETHDTDTNGHGRLNEEIAPGDGGGYFARKRATLGAGIVLTAPGIPMLFQGQEFQQSGQFSRWAVLDWANTETYSGIVELYKHLIALRQNRYSHTAGLTGQHLDVFHVDDQHKVMAYHRWNKAGPGDNVVVVANFANKSQRDYRIAFPAKGMWHVRFNSDWSGYGSDFTDMGIEQVEARPDEKDRGKISGALDIGPYSLLILSQAP